MSRFQTPNSVAPGTALAHTVFGEPVASSGRPNSTGEGIALVTTQSVFRPYEKPKRRRKDNGSTLCASEGCRAYPTATGHCVGHSRSLGLIENWNQEGRKRDEPD